MPLLTLDFTAKLQAKAFQKKPQPFMVTVDEYLNMLSVFPLLGSYHIMHAALQADYLSQKDQDFWETQSFPKELEPMSMSFAKAARKFCEKYVTLRLVYPQAIRSGTIIELQVADHRSERTAIKFRGKVTQLFALQPVR